MTGRGSGARLRAEDIHPQLRGIFRFVPNPPVRRPRMLRLMQIGSARMAGPRRLVAGVEHRFLRLGEGAGAHVFRPAHSAGRAPAAGTDPGRAGVLWIHGGGYVLGSAAQDHARCMRLARDLGVVVVSAEYRPAPASAFPAALDDVHAAWELMIHRADELGIDAGRIAVAGQSAGGGLAAALVQRVHDEGGAQPSAQWLFCPMLDDRTAADRSLDSIRHYLWDNRSNRTGWASYLGREPGGPDAPPYAVPARRTDLGGLPATWIGVGDIDLFHDEDRRYAEALSAAGVPTVLETVPGAPHAFESIRGGAPISRAYLHSAESWLSRQLGLSPSASPAHQREDHETPEGDAS